MSKKGFLTYQVAKVKEAKITKLKKKNTTPENSNAFKYLNKMLSLKCFHKNGDKNVKNQQQ